MRIYIDDNHNLRLEPDNLAEIVELICMAQDYKDNGEVVVNVDSIQSEA